MKRKEKKQQLFTGATSLHVSEPSHKEVKKWRQQKHKPLSIFKNTFRHNIGSGKDILFYNPMNRPKKIQNTRENITHGDGQHNVTRDEEHVSKKNTQAIQLPVILRGYIKYLQNNLKPRCVLLWKVASFHIQYSCPKYFYYKVVKWSPGWAWSPSWPFQDQNTFTKILFPVPLVVHTLY